MPRSKHDFSLKSIVPKEIMTNLRELVLSKDDEAFLEFVEKWEIPSYEFGLLPSQDLKAIFMKFDNFFEKILNIDT